ncbi:EAL domain-containing protein [Brenneria goodwinii]|uniref:bifunctional diguanylate cyclase/phosphodiesterase n=2 Tax=Brenneria goodwinii TaxID=1109412 RepID=UPI001EFB2F9A|nr:EAL domain-containing protein [Brenneria goodwinii]MCG8165938.1 EAL domain-containing protein [Brenneria goodwinii]MCG8175294.1 EAL domain-containing protein [Brenneria goodwinii]MCG8180319.1 EAL domain-containing protein [Brenneria goodwinii]
MRFNADVKPRRVSTVFRRGYAIAMMVLLIEKVNFMKSHPLKAETVTESIEEGLLAAAVNGSDSAILISRYVDGQRRTAFVNAGFTQLFGYSQQEASGHDPGTLIRCETEFGCQPDKDEVREAHHRYRVETRVYHKSGYPLWCSIALNHFYDERNNIMYAISVFTEITATKMYEVLQFPVLEALARDRPLEEVMERLCLEIESIAPEVICSVSRVDEHGCLRPLASPRLPASYSQALDGIPIGPKSGSSGTAAWLGVPVMVRDIAHNPLWEECCDLVLPLGLAACWSSPIFSSQNKVIGTLAFYFRQERGPSKFHQNLVTLSTGLCALAIERYESSEKIRLLAFFDPLTGLPNRNLFRASADNAVINAARRGNTLAVLMISLDRFKQVSGSLGAAAGDKLLCHIAECLRQQCGAADLVGKLSVDEFAMLLNIDDVRNVTAKAERLLSMLSKTVPIDGVMVTPSVTIGINLYPDNSHDMGALIQGADIALHQAKYHLRGRLGFFNKEMNEIAKRRLTLESALRKALEDFSLQLYYQPQISLKNGEIHGVEALSRWFHPEFGEISPIRFIPLAEECGLMDKLGEWVLQEACRQLADWHRRGVNVPTVSINLSPTNFHNPELPALISRILSQLSLPPDNLTIEITEEVILDGNADTMNILNKVRELGVKLSMDDFGTGFASLSYLNRINFDEVKLDQSFVHDIECHHKNRVLTDAVTHIGDKLDLCIVAEGVENETQREILAQQGYELAQGFLFSRPLPPAQLEAWSRHYGLTKR